MVQNMCMSYHISCTKRGLMYGNTTLPPTEFICLYMKSTFLIYPLTLFLIKDLNNARRSRNLLSSLVFTNN